MPDDAVAAATSIPTSRERFLIELAKFLGIKPLPQNPLQQSVVTEPWHFEECLTTVLGDGETVKLTFERFNTLMLHTRRPLASRDFFEEFFGKVKDLDTFEGAVERFRQEALWHF